MDVTAKVSEIATALAGDNTKIERMDPQIVLALGFCTFGLYPLYKFLRAALQYEALAGRKTNVQVLLAAYFGTWLMGALCMRWLVGLVFVLGSVVIGLLVLNEVLRLRGDVVQRYGVTAELQEVDAQRAAWAAASLLGWLGIGIVAAVVQCWWFFRDHTRIAEAIEGQQQQAC